MVTFSDYYRQKMASASQQPQRPSSSLPEYDFSGLSGFAQKAQENKPYGVLDTIIDLISRPLYGVTNAVTGVSEGIADSRENGNPLSAVGGAAAIPTNFLSSFFGTTGEEGKRTFSKVIEQQTDRHGKINDPNYEDTENNVDPVLKGVLGFLGDVAFDPLMYVPGAAVAKAGGMVARGAKGAVKGVETAARGTKGAEEAAAVAKTADDAPVAVRAVEEDNVFPTIPDELTQESLSKAQRLVRKRSEPTIDVSPGAVESWAKSSNIPEVRSAWIDYNAKLAKASSSLSGKVPATFSGKTIAEAEQKLTQLYRRHRTAELPVKITPQADRTWTEMFKSATAGPGAEAVRGELSAILAKVSKSAPAEAKATQSPNEWLGARLNSMIDEADYDTVLDAIPRVPPAVQAKLDEAMLSVSGDGAPYTYRRLNSLGEGSDDVAKLSRIMLKTLYQRGATDEAATGVTDALMAFNLRRTQHEDTMRASLGDKLFDYLERKADSSKTTAASFQKALEDLGRVADPAIDMGVISKLGIKNGENFGAPVSALNAYTDTLGLPRYVKPAANTPDEAAAARDAVASQGNAAYEAIAHVFRETVHGPQMKQNYPVNHGNRGRATDVDREVATRRFNRQLNTFFQYDLGKAMVNSLVRRMEQRVGKDASKIAGIQRSSEWRNATYETWDAAVDVLTTLGIKMHIGVGKQPFVPLSYPDILRITEQAIDNPALSQAVLFNGGTQLAPTRLMEAVHYLVTSGSRGDQAVADVTAILSNKKVTGYRGQVLDKDIANNALKSAPYAHFTGKSAEESARKYALQTGGKVSKNADKGWYVVSPNGGFVPVAAKALVEGADNFAVRAAENAAAFSARGVSETKSLTTAQIARMERVFVEGSFEDAVNTLAKIRQGLTKDAQEIAALPSSVDAAEAAVKAVTGSFEQTRARYFSQMSTKVAETPAKRKALVTENATKQAEQFGKEADDITHFDDVVELGDTARSSELAVKSAEPDVPVYDIAGMNPDYGLRELASQQGFVASALFGARKFFDQSFGMKNLFGIFHAKHTVSGQVMAETVDSLRALNKYTPDQLTAAMAAVKSGVANGNAEVTAAAKAIESVLSRVFDLDPAAKSILNSPLLRTEPNIEHINAILRQKAGKETSFQLQEFDDVAKLAGQWRDWDITDPITDLYKITDAFVTAAEHRAIVGNFLYEMGKHGLVSQKYAPGMVKIGDSGGSKFAALIPEGTFVSKEVARELHVLDSMVRTDRKFQGEIGEFFQKTFIPTQNIWKQLVTVWRPGHHVRNHLGNVFMSWQARGNAYYVSSYKDALKVMGLKNNYHGADLIESLTAIGERIPKSSEVMVSGRHTFTADEISKLAQDHGLMSSYATTEDLMLDVASGKLGKLGADLANSKVGRMAGGASHFVDHHGKLQHFIQILKQESAKHGRWGNLSKNELVKRAVNEVKRSHPDSLMLSAGEAKWRFLIPFYTWFAKTMPFAMESAARNPGRLSVLPKASYALAESMGINPNSLSDPFPEDQLFPSFVTNGAFGPQFQIDGNYVNINPGSPQYDMLNQLFSPDPVQGILGMTSPLLRVPAELATGSKVGGIPINDYSDYVDQNIPIVNYLANVTGHSITGSAASVLQGKGLDPQLQVERGNKTGFDQSMSVVSWLSGLNAQNWSRPNFINYAEIEKRNRASKSDRSGF